VVNTVSYLIDVLIKGVRAVKNTQEPDYRREPERNKNRAHHFIDRVQVQAEACADSEYSKQEDSDQQPTRSHEGIT